jgi:hypothetical protein
LHLNLTDSEPYKTPVRKTTTDLKWSHDDDLRLNLPPDMTADDDDVSTASEEEKPKLKKQPSPQSPLKRAFLEVSAVVFRGVRFPPSVYITKAQSVLSLAHIYIYKFVWLFPDSH